MMGGSFLLFVYFLILFLLAYNEARVHKKENLLEELMQKHDISEDLATKLTCLAGATNYDTSYNVTRMIRNRDQIIEYTNFGIFGISSSVCLENRGVCSNTCANFIDGDITDDLFCVHNILDNHVDKVSSLLLTDETKLECQWLMRETVGCSTKREIIRSREYNSNNIKFESEDAKVHHGYPSSKHLPHMAALGWIEPLDNTVTWSCGGSLITEDTILTAAHCTVRGSQPVDIIRLGDSNLLTDDDDKEKAQQYEVESIIRHPDYKGKYNDIALIKLKVKAKLSESVIPACLWMDYAFPINSEMFGTGYGQTVESGPMSSVLMEYVQTAYETSACSEYYQRQRGLERGLDDKVHLCARDISGRNMDACQGDSGGPLELRLLHKLLKVSFITGIVSFGKKCLDYEDPAVYTRVSTYIDWIRSHCPELSINSTHCAIQHEHQQNIITGSNKIKFNGGIMEGNIFGEDPVPEGVTGVVITDRYVLTSAQKLRKISRPNRILLDRVFFIENIIYHPDSTNLDQRTTLVNDDVALVKLTKKVELYDVRSWKSPACIETRIKGNKDFRIQGVFYDQTHHVLDFHSEDLLHCLSYFSLQLQSLNIERKNLLCFDSYEKYLPDSCQLPVGSFVYDVTPIGYMTNIKGIVLLSDNCGPTIATDVEAYADWMDSILTNKN